MPVGSIVANGQNREVLVVDDSEVVRILITVMLRDEGYSVFEAATCEQAHDVLAAQRISVVLCDFSLAGGVNGVDCVRSALRLHPHLKCVLMSGFFALRNRPELPFPVISKPFDAATIAALLNRVLEDDSASRAGE